MPTDPKHRGVIVLSVTGVFLFASSLFTIAQVPSHWLAYVLSALGAVVGLFLIILAALVALERM